ncbi:hypothetical protein LCGC14_2630250 [marine sediment metagenome]|uniref:Uncharacterized protein n=1 Tax=marine sediment metagenome TaxID=412755 RepID=A0A0F9CSW8_9ZZZZ
MHPRGFFVDRLGRAIDARSRGRKVADMTLDRVAELAQLFPVLLSELVALAFLELGFQFVEDAKDAEMGLDELHDIHFVYLSQGLGCLGGARPADGLNAF